MPPPDCAQLSRPAHTKKKKFKIKLNRTSRQTQVGIGHSAPAKRGGHVQNRSRRREQRQGRQRTRPQAEQPRMDGRTTRQEGEGWPIFTQTEAASCTPQTTHQARTPRLETRIATSYAKGGDVSGAAAGSRRNGKRQAVAATTGVRPEGSAASNTADAWSDPKHTLKRSSQKSLTASVPPAPKIHGHSNSRSSMWRHLCYLPA